MRKAVLAKFIQHAELRELLLATGDAKIVEHTERDDYWGDGGNGRGKNMLGRILMEVREQLGRRSPTPDQVRQLLETRENGPTVSHDSVSRHVKRAIARKSKS